MPPVSSRATRRRAVPWSRLHPYLVRHYPTLSGTERAKIEWTIRTGFPHGFKRPPGPPLPGWVKADAHWHAGKAVLSVHRLLHACEVLMAPKAHGKRDVVEQRIMAAPEYELAVWPETIGQAVKYELKMRELLAENSPAPETAAAVEIPAPSAYSVMRDGIPASPRWLQPRQSAPEPPAASVELESGPAIQTVVPTAEPDAVRPPGAARKRPEPEPPKELVDFVTCYERLAHKNSEAFNAWETERLQAARQDPDLARQGIRISRASLRKADKARQR
jgi:hypothetical protein